MRSAFGDSTGSARGPRPTRWPSRGKMRSSRGAAAASRPRMVTSRRQSDDHSSEITRTLAGPRGWAASQRIAAI